MWTGGGRHAAIWPEAARQITPALSRGAAPSDSAPTTLPGDGGLCVRCTKGSGPTSWDSVSQTAAWSLGPRRRGHPLSRRKWAEAAWQSPSAPRYHLPTDAAPRIHPFPRNAPRVSGAPAGEMVKALQRPVSRLRRAEIPRSARSPWQELRKSAGPRCHALRPSSAPADVQCGPQTPMSLPRPPSSSSVFPAVAHWGHRSKQEDCHFTPRTPISDGAEPVPEVKAMNGRRALPRPPCSHTG